MEASAFDSATALMASETLRPAALPVPRGRPTRPPPCGRASPTRPTGPVLPSAHADLAGLLDARPSGLPAGDAGSAPIAGTTVAGDGRRRRLRPPDPGPRLDTRDAVVPAREGSCGILVLPITGIGATWSGAGACWRSCVVWDSAVGGGWPTSTTWAAPAHPGPHRGGDGLGPGGEPGRRGSGLVDGEPPPSGPGGAIPGCPRGTAGNHVAATAGDCPGEGQIPVEPCRLICFWGQRRRLRSQRGCTE